MHLRFGTSDDIYADIRNTSVQFKKRSALQQSKTYIIDVPIDKL